MLFKPIAICVYPLIGSVSNFNVTNLKSFIIPTLNVVNDEFDFGNEIPPKSSLPCHLITSLPNHIIPCITNLTILLQPQT